MIHDLRNAAQTLRQAPVFTVTAIIVMALGIGAGTAMFAVVNAWLLRPLPLARPSELVAVWRTAATHPREPAYFDLYRDYLVWAADTHTLTGLAATFDQDYALTGTGEARRLHGEVATWNTFAVVGVQPAAGRLFDASDARGDPSCVISYALWQSQFGGSRETIGRTIQLNDRPYRVLGVLPIGFSLRILDRPFDADVWTLILADDPRHSTTSTSPVAVVGRLKPGVDAAQAEADLAAIQAASRRSDEPPGSGMLVTGLQADNTRTVRSSLWLLMTAVGCLLLIACVNTSSLIAGRHAQRRREFAVRLALGCTIPRLLRQLTLEVLLLFAAGGVLGLLIASVVLRLFTAANPFGVLPPGGLSIDPMVLATTAAIVCAAALVFGSLPAARGLRRLDSDPLRVRAGTPDTSQIRSRTVFVALEIALSMVLLVGAGLLLATFARIAAEPLGFDMRHVSETDVALPFSRYPTVESQTRFGDALVARLESLPSVRAAAVAASWPFQANGLNPIEIDDPSTTLDRAPQAFRFTVGQGYFAALGITLLRGRAFTSADGPRAVDVAVINSAMARRAFPGGDPIGRRVRIRYPGQPQPTEPWLTIVGVVSDMRSQRYDHIDWDEAPAVYAAFAQRRDVGAAGRFDSQTIYIYARGSLDGSALRKAVEAEDRDLPVGAVRLTSDIVSDLRAQPRLRAQVLGGFALLTVVLALVGVYGAMAQFVELRRREIGIRIALGAATSRVVGIVVRRALAIALAGLAVGGFGALAAGRLLQSALYGVSPADPVVFIAVALALVAIALAASYRPARAAASVDPAVTLRSE